ncbi:MAG TPA: HD domain-containing protein [Candidatus Tectomicrobia bacterium]
MDNILLILRYWGKAKPVTNSGPQWYPLIYHCLDVAACGRKFLEADTERRQALARIPQACGDEPTFTACTPVAGVCSPGMWG